MTRPTPTALDRHRPWLVLAVALVLTACGADEPDPGAGSAPNDPAATAAQEAFPMTVENCGREVTFDAPPERVVTIGAEAPVLVAAAGAADRVTAVGGAVQPEFFGDYRAELEDIPRLGSVAAELSAEVLIAEEPDLLISINSDNFEALEAAGIPGLVIGGRCRGADDANTSDGSFEEFYNDITLYGQLFGTSDVAESAVEDLTERVAAVREQFAGTQERSAITVIYGSSGDQLGSYGGSSIADAQLRALGLTNVFADQDERFFEPSVEEIVSRDPEVVVLLFEVAEGTDAMSLAKLQNSPELASITGLQSGDIITLPFALAGSSPGSVVGLEMLAEQLAALDGS